MPEKGEPRAGGAARKNTCADSGLGHWLWYLQPVCPDPPAALKKLRCSDQPEVASLAQIPLRRVHRLPRRLVTCSARLALPRLPDPSPHRCRRTVRHSFTFRFLTAGTRSTPEGLRGTKTMLVSHRTLLTFCLLSCCDCRRAVFPPLWPDAQLVLVLLFRHPNKCDECPNHLYVTTNRHYGFYSQRSCPTSPFVLLTI